ncbi:Gamma-secretase subunit Aph-1 [Trinorchestia longiramus]|nr:Gamma-secretase subunit Aph-1 [Trinorchestia longiramus]
MTLAQFFGCGMIAFGPPLVLFIVTMASDPIRVIMLVASSFFWLLSLLFSSILYKVVVPLQPHLAFGALFSVLFQEFFRFLWFMLIQKAEVGLKKVSEDNLEIIENKHILAYVSGLGFGLISGAFALVNVLADMAGPGTVGLRGDSPSFFVATTFTSLAFIFLHVCWGVIFFAGVHRRNYVLILFVLVSHVLATGVTLLNPLYAVTVSLVWLLLLPTAVLALYVTGVSRSSISNSLKFSDRAYRVDAVSSTPDQRAQL